METYAIHLPQFHRIPENDRWWGDGFTEWVNVKKAMPLYQGHEQPLIPLGGHYYDLTEKSELVWQHELAREYGLAGFVYYHYWFNGKLLLERPVEILRETPEACLKYSLCWANEPWTRAWDGKNKEVIQPQTFGGEEDWLSHILYLSRFFTDERYQTVDGRPVLYIYSPRNIPDFDEMVEFWNNWLESNGFERIYLIEYLSSFNPKPYSKYSEAVLEFEPLYSSHYEISKMKLARRFISKKTQTLDIVDYDYLWEKILNKDSKYDGRSIIRSAFTNFDNTPRKGSRGFITKGASPEKFSHYFLKLIESDRENYCDIAVINAWNEWGEGAILEPTENHGYAWLEGLRKAINREK